MYLKELDEWQPVHWCIIRHPQAHEIENTVLAAIHTSGWLQSEIVFYSSNISNKYESILNLFICDLSDNQALAGSRVYFKILVLGFQKVDSGIFRNFQKPINDSSLYPVPKFYSYHFDNDGTIQILEKID